RGDISAVTDTVRYYAEIFNLVMLADARPDNQGTHYLREVAIGFSMHIGDRNVVVTSDTQGQLGGDLSIIGRSVLSGNYDALSDLKQVARTPQTMLIDAPALMLRSGKHVKMIVRYFVWVDPGSGRIGTLAWLLDTAGRFEGQSPTLQVLPPMMMEDRVMHVDGEQFNFLGIPSPTAFALVQMPQGQAFPVTEAMRPLAGKPTYDPESYAKLVNAITAALSS
ncbi:MAG: pyruvate kinase, partial [Planctomycetota bacterium]